MKKTFFRKIALTALSLLLASNSAISVFCAPVADTFTDVNLNAWYGKSVEYVVENEIMKGTSSTKFAPAMEFSRAMTVQVLARLSGDDFADYKTAEFPDVAEGEWYTAAIAWAVDKGVAKGTGRGFDPNGSVTREQLALMIAQFADKYGVSNKYAAGPDTLDVFNDSKNVSSWAVDGMAWAVYNGIISGKGDSVLDPKGTATRVEAAKIFYFVDFMIKNGVVPPDTTDFDAIEMEYVDNPTILCWGDSMTQGYPDYLRKDYKLKVRNLSSGGEKAEFVSMKQGGTPLYVAPFTIPATTEKVAITLLDDTFREIHWEEGFLYLGNNGLTPVLIHGIKGNVHLGDDGIYYFNRIETTPQKEVEVTRPTRVVTNGMRIQNANDIHLIFSGPSNGYEWYEYDKLIEAQSDMIEYMGTDHYIIISLTSWYYLPNVDKFNEGLKEYYGEKFLDFRSYLLTDEAFKAAGIEPTEQDLEDIAIGEIPSSFRSDLEHGNHYFNKLLADQLYLKMIELGYIEG
ncbi:MAG: S-layer homology domain-containing protein [Clostridia bacterium]|nr:S-layer homology domain-containing protein [Clostridia bacterium]